MIVVGPAALGRAAAAGRARVRPLARRRTRSIDALLDAPSAEADRHARRVREYEIPEQLLVRDLMTERPRTTTRRYAAARRPRAS